MKSKWSCSVDFTCDNRSSMYSCDTSSIRATKLRKRDILWRIPSGVRRQDNMANMFQCLIFTNAEGSSSCCGGALATKQNTKLYACFAEVNP